MSDKTSLGDRMKTYESQQTERYLIPCLPVYARIDGKTFSTFTKGFARPFDEELHTVMMGVTAVLVEKTHAVIGYTQSDEISLAWYPEDFKSEIFFGGRIFKIIGELAALATSAFTIQALTEGSDRLRERTLKLNPRFDARVYNTPNLDEAANAFLWREQDATKNAITQAAGAVYSHKELHKKNGSDKQEMLFQKGINFNDYPAWFKRGAYVRKINEQRELSMQELMNIPPEHRPKGPVTRSRITELDVPPLGKLTNRVDFLFRGETPIVEE